MMNVPLRFCRIVMFVIFAISVFTLYSSRNHQSTIRYQKIKTIEELQTTETKIERFEPTESKIGNIESETETTETKISTILNLYNETNTTLNMTAGLHCTDEQLLGGTKPGTVNPVKPTLNSFAELDDEVDCLPGGDWFVDRKNLSSPSNCTPLSVAIIIPCRDRHAHLLIFLRHIHEYLQRQAIHYRVFVVEQVSNQTFNKAKLLNVGFVESQRYGDFECFILHDVDIFPVVYGIPYRCSTAGPLHFAASVDKFDWHLMYPDLFGGVTGFTREQFEKVNGMTNRFWGWGGEDDEVFQRIKLSSQKFQRLPASLAKYSMIKHKQDAGNKPKEKDRWAAVYKTNVTWKTDGLNNLDYVLKTDSAVIKKTYTHIIADLLEDEFLRNMHSNNSNISREID